MTTVNVTDRVMRPHLTNPLSGAPSKPRAARRLVSNDWFIRIMSVVVGLLIWELIGSHYPYSMSSPLGVVRAVKKFLVPQVLPAAYESLKTFSLAFAICVFFGIPIGLAMARIKFVRLAIQPYVSMLNSLPMLALFPLLILVFGINTEIRVAACVLFGIWSVIVNTFTGASRVDVTLQDVGRSFVASGWKRLTTIIIPGSLNYIFAGTRIGFGHAMIGAVVIELEASLVGVGSLLQRYSQNLQLAPYFIVVLVLGLFSISFSVVLKRFQRWATMPWERSHRLSDRHATSHATMGMSSDIGNRGVNPLTKLLRGSRAALRPIVRPVRTVVGSTYRFIASGARFFTGRATAWILRVVVFVGLIALWQYEYQHVNQGALPAPHAVAKAFYHLTFQTHAIFAPLFNSLELFGAGFLISLVIGIPTGLAMGRYRRFELVLDPYVSFMYALPLVVFVPIMVIWLGFGFNFGVAFVVVSAVFIVIINTMQGVHSVDRELIDVGRSFCSSERKILRTIIIPSTVPFVIAGARLAFSVSWIGVIVSEVVSSETGLGGQIATYQTQYLLADMFVPVLYIAAISVVLVGLANRYAPRLTPWSDVSR
ncbi:MAG TPA: ABC transporter permease subunit [Acidimicrobiales bacterium]